MIKVFIDSILAGLFISIGGVAFLSVDSKVIGAILFTVGLFSICTFKLNLFTGKVCYIFQKDKQYLFNVLLIWLGNFVGCYLSATLINLTRIGNKLSLLALELVNKKIDDNYLSLFILAIFCNILIYLAVEQFNNNPHELGKYLGLLFGVVVFIVCGFEHCVANMFYISIAKAWSSKAFISLLIMTLGNTVGGVLIPLLRKKGS